MNDTPMSPRVTVRRGTHRAEYDRTVMMRILRAGYMAHVGVATADGPLVLPMAYGVTDDTMYLHGALANSLLRAGANTDVCVTVTLLDGLVLAKTPFNHTMNYRSVVVRGTARVVDNADEHLAALRAVSDHIVPNWDSSRPPTAEELRATRVVAVPLSEMSAKVRVGMPTNDEADTDGNHWCGVIPLVSHWGEPSTAPDAGATVPRSIARFAGTEVSPPRE